MSTGTRRMRRGPTAAASNPAHGFAPLPLPTDLNLTPKDIAGLISADALAAFFQGLGYETSRRSTLTPQAIGLAGDAAAPIKSIEVLCEDPEGFLRVVFVQLRSLTAKSRNDLARVLGKTNVDHLLVFTSNYDTLEFVLLDKRRDQRRGPGASDRVQVVPLSITVDRRGAGRLELRALRRFTWTCRDALDQFDKLRSVFEAAAFTEEHFQNRALFADHYLVERLKDDPAWRENPSNIFLEVKDRLRDATRRWQAKGEQIVRDELYEPLFRLLGFDPVAQKKADEGHLQPDYVLYPGERGASAAWLRAAPGSSPVATAPEQSQSNSPEPTSRLTPAARHDEPLTAAFVYHWDRWLDGPDINDEATPDENPGACVVSALESGIADWIIVTNGRQWRLYSKQTHSRATNFYEVDLPEALSASGDTDPNEAFRYWWLFFRSQAFARTRRAGDVSPPVTSSAAQPAQQATDDQERATSPPLSKGGPGEVAPPAQSAPCWLDQIVAGSRDYAKRLGERLKDRIFKTIFPHLAEGFLEDRRQRLGIKAVPTDDELKDLFEATLTLLYRLLFLLYAESRDLLPIREAPYRAASLKKIKEEIAERAGIAESEAADCIARAYSEKETALYDRLTRLFQAMDKGDPTLNVPIYNGGLFQTSPPDAPKSGEPGGVSPRIRSEKSDVPAANAQQTQRQSEENRAPDSRDLRIARFLLDHKVPDRFLALAIDRLARDEDEKTFSLVFIDYKSLEVRHLGSIYEGLLEFKLKIAEEDLATQTEKGREKFIPLSQAKPKRAPARALASGRRKPAGDSRPDKAIAVAKGAVYLSNDKAERKASGSYYTPDPIVEYIVEQTVGPVLAEKLEALRPEFRKVRKTFDRERENAAGRPIKKHDGTTWGPREYAEEATFNAHKHLVEALFEFRVLDPAMGSGHFLVEAVDFLSDRLLTFLNGFPINPVSFALKRTRKNILEALQEQGVSIDPEKLTEINLLRRHVLKRCIYGVDLNPMAVELAKVSLWLDAFTLGAPLSFLDHHLRCGNSLIGATFKDLAAATKGSLFRIDYVPLMLAIQQVVSINRRTDTTATEVKTSTSEYDQAREKLGGYRNVLDLLVAKHFGFPDAPKLLTHGHLDLGNERQLLASLPEEWERELVRSVEACARQPHCRFFHWEVEFPEVFFGLTGPTGATIQHKDEISAGSAGFDAVVGNPPYDELSEHAAGRELPEKDFLKETPLYADAQGGRLNVFRPFIIRSLSVLRRGGRHSFIVPMALLADSFTAALRRHMLEEGFVRTVVVFPQKDDPHRRIFFEAKLSTCVFVAEKDARPDHVIAISTFPGNSFADAAKECRLTVAEIRTLEPDGLSLPAISGEDLANWRTMNRCARAARFRDAAKCYLGELMTNASNAHLTSEKPVGPRLLRGANINFYVLLDEPKQGEPLYLRERQFLKEYAGDIRSKHHNDSRIGFQESCPIDNWRRLIACVIPPGHYCVHKIRYFAPDAKYDIHAILAVFNSAMADWRFSLTSTNNSINAYEVDAIPIPRFARLHSEEDRPTMVDWDRWDRHIGSSDRDACAWDDAVRAEITATPAESNEWPNSIHDALASAGREMSRLGAERQRLTNDFAEWLTAELTIDDDSFSGWTYIRGGQATFDEMGWPEFADLLKRNRRACGIDPAHRETTIEPRYADAAAELQVNRAKFDALRTAIDRVVWELVGLGVEN